MSHKTGISISHSFIAPLVAVMSFGSLTGGIFSF